jgi:hypothetical protein
MVACQELRQEDVQLYRSGDGGVIGAPITPAPAVADIACATAEHKDVDVVAPDEETFAAMRWASKLDDESCVLGLIRSLPTAVVEEQVSLYRRRTETAVAVSTQKHGPQPKIILRPNSLWSSRMEVAKRFHMYCAENAIDTDTKLPYGAMNAFIAQNITWTGTGKLRGCLIRAWYSSWRSTSSNALAAAVAGNGAPSQTPNQKSMLKSRAKVQLARRKRAHGGGRQPKAYCVRVALYEWFTSIRYAIDWRQMIAENRSRGKKTLGTISSGMPEAQSAAAHPRVHLFLLIERQTCSIVQG